MAARQIGVLTFHKCINYGSYWQARCLVEGLRSRGHQAVLLEHDCPRVGEAELRCSLQPTLPERTPRRDLPRYKAKARKFFDAFERLPTSRRFSLHQPQDAGAFDAVVIGSDEVWNHRHPWYGNAPIFFGEGLRTDRLVSYAASFGNYDAEQGLGSDWASRLERFAAISVRDDNSRRLVSDGLGTEPTLVLDPCLQFPDAITAAPVPAERPYALIYGHGFPDWLGAATRRWSEARGIRLVSVGYATGWADEQRIEAGPEEFAGLMASASAVVTNFFHGCVFALLNGKPLATAPSDYRFNKVRDLAAKLALPHRIVGSDTPQHTFDALLDTPLEQAVHDRIRDYRQRSQSFLDAALC
ncbi:polysaccharide pyruvyl transferase family protein [Sphingomonas sp. GCM10030256]|uniref:polysaccharide pyruvyl transferase family protein n=1 Tax=Sphingomonas sp. GCM10030256 TaxID=3273427 RepID=UPI00360E755B